MHKFAAVALMVLYLPLFGRAQKKTVIAWQRETKIYESVLTYLTVRDSLPYWDYSPSELSVDPGILLKANPGSQSQNKDLIQIPSNIVRIRQGILNSLNLSATDIISFSKCQNYDAFPPPPAPTGNKKNQNYQNQRDKNSECKKYKGRLGIGFGKFRHENKEGAGSVRLFLLTTYSYHIYKFSLHKNNRRYQVSEVKLIEFVAG